jgi:hypothetical protein
MSKTKKTTEPKDYKSLQLWPGGASVDVAGSGKRMLVRTHGWNGDKHGPWHKPTPEEYRAVRIEQIAEDFADRGIMCCDSSLVSDAMQLSDSGEGELGEEFSYENVKNLRPDPDEWTIEQCKEWLEDKGHGLPDPDPTDCDLTNMTGRVEMALDDETAMPVGVDALKAVYLELLNEGRIDGFEDAAEQFRDAVRDNAENAEVYQWFRVEDWLASELDAIGECVMENSYGQWWGRQCCGQALIMDGTMQKIAAAHFDQYEKR